MLVLTFAPSLLTFASCTCGAILLSTSASTPLAHMVVVTGCNLRWWCFPSAIGANTPCTGGGVTRCNLCWWSFSFHPLTHILHLSLGHLHCVVVVCGGGSSIYMDVEVVYIYTRAREQTRAYSAGKHTKASTNMHSKQALSPYTKFADS